MLLVVQLLLYFHPSANISIAGRIDTSTGVKSLPLSQNAACVGHVFCEWPSVDLGEDNTRMLETIPDRLSFPLKSSEGAAVTVVT